MDENKQDTYRLQQELSYRCKEKSKRGCPPTLIFPDQIHLWRKKRLGLKLACLEPENIFGLCIINYKMLNIYNSKNL